MLSERYPAVVTYATSLTEVRKVERLIRGQQGRRDIGWWNKMGGISGDYVGDRDRGNQRRKRWRGKKTSEGDFLK